MKSLILLVLPWHLLTWSDFRGKPDGKASSCTNAGNQIWLKCKNDKCRVYVETTFFPDSSYTETDSKYVLKHEQGHLDIAEIFTRRLRKEYKKMEPIDDTDSMFNVVVRMQVENGIQREEMQHKYDSATQHSLIESEQKKWDLFIAKELAK